MNKFLKSVLFIFLTIMSGTLSVSAYDFEYDGLYYKLLPNGTVSVVNGDVAYSGDIVIPPMVDRGELSYPVTAIGEQAFFCCNELTSVVIPDGVETIGKHAFYGCSSLTKITIGTGVKSIANYAFLDITADVHITNLAAWCDINFGGEWANPLCIDGRLWVNGELAEDIEIPDGVASIKPFAFYRCASIRSVKIPDSVKSIGQAAFRYCGNITDIQFGGGIKTIGFNSFGSCSGLTNLNLPSSLETIGHSAFAMCKSLSEVVIPDGVTSISGEAFHSCKAMKTVVLGKSVGSMDYGVFANCESLETVILPSSLISMGENVFIGCNSIKSVSCGAMTPPAAPMSSFTDAAYATAALIVPDDAVDSYTQSQWCWSLFANLRGESAGISDAAADGVEVKVVGHNVVIEGDKNGPSVSIYSLDGALVYRGNDSVISLSNRGVYIVTVGGNTCKIIM